MRQVEQTGHHHHGPTRPPEDHRPLFVTFPTHRRWKLPPPARDIVLERILAENDEAFVLHAAVVMPDHVHLLVSPLRDESGGHVSIPEIVRKIKLDTAQAINRALGRIGAVWQDERLEHLAGNETPEKKVEAVCQNPVRAGLAGKPADYPWLWRQSGE